MLLNYKKVILYYCSDTFLQLKFHVESVYSCENNLALKGNLSSVLKPNQMLRDPKYYSH